MWPMPTKRNRTDIISTNFIFRHFDRVCRTFSTVWVSYHFNNMNQSHLIQNWYTFESDKFFVSSNDVVTTRNHCTSSFISVQEQRLWVMEVTRREKNLAFLNGIRWSQHFIFDADRHCKISWSKLFWPVQTRRKKEFQQIPFSQIAWNIHEFKCFD